MSFVNNSLHLTERVPGQGKLIRCSKCERERVPEGGVQLNQTKWLCASCWTLRVIRKK